MSKIENMPAEWLRGPEPAENMRTSEASHYLRIPESTLAKLRMRANRDRGPRFVKLSGTVIYRRADLDSWMEANVVTGSK